MLAVEPEGLVFFVLVRSVVAENALVQKALIILRLSVAPSYCIRVEKRVLAQGLRTFLRLGMVCLEGAGVSGLLWEKLYEVEFEWEII